MKAIKYAMMAIALSITFCIEMTGQCDKPTWPSNWEVNTTDDSFEVQWDAMPNACEYIVRTRFRGQFSYDTVTTNTYLKTDLPSCATYEVWVRSLCDDGSGNCTTLSNYSAVKNTMTNSCPSSYDVPKLVHAKFIDGSNIEVKWRPVNAACKYQVQLREKGTSSWTSKWAYSSKANFPNLSSCTNYEFRVRAFYPNESTSKCTNSTTFSGSVEAITSGCLAVVPNELNLKADAASTGDKIYVRWVPTDYPSMQWGAKYGYKITRTTLMQGDSTSTAFDRRNSKIILAPLAIPIDDSTHWNNLSANNDMYGVAAGALFGEEMVAQSVDSVDLMEVVSMNQTQETQFTYGLFAADSDFAIAEEMALGFMDANVVAGEQYLYTIQFNNVDPSLTEANSGSAIKSTEDSIQLIPVADLTGAGGDSTAFLSWDNSQTEDVYVSFWVERSDDGGTTFQAVNDDPIIYTSNAGSAPGQINFNDGLPDNTNTYIFRVKGKSPFGIEGPVSDTVHVKGRPAPIPIAPGLTNVEEVTVGTMDVTWDFDPGYESEIQGFEVYRAPSRDSIFVPITSGLLSPSTRTFTDSSPEPLNYYRVVVHDVNNYEIPSLVVMGQLNDETPPDPPIAVAGNIDDNGVMTLTWAASPSSDVMGYRVYASNQKTGEFSQLTSNYLLERKFYDMVDLSMMVDKIYVGVKAIDKHENYSNMSQILALKRPDKIPPAAPMFTAIEAGYSSIEMRWELSNSPDVRFHRLERKVMNQAEWTEIVSFNQSDRIREYKDVTTIAGVWYEYRLLAYDEANNFSSSNIVKSRGIDSGVRPAIEDLTGQLFSNPNPTFDYQNSSGSHLTVNLNWTYPREYRNLIGFTIFRGADSTNMATLKTISIDEAQQMATGFGGGGSGINYGFIDSDLLFGLKVRTNYTIPSRYNPANPGNIPPRPNGNPVLVNVPRSNPSIPTVNTVPGIGNNPQPIPTSFELFYQVMAVFSDGSMSHLSNFAIITF